MANYGRGWEDGYGGQSKEAVDLHSQLSEGMTQLAKRQRSLGKEFEQALLGNIEDLYDE